MGIFSTKSAYEALFTGAILFAPWERIWHSWAPGKCRFFMWTVAHKKCWTADRLEKKGSLTRKHVLFVTKMGKPLTICWYPVYLVGKYGLMFYNTLAYRSWHHKLGKGRLRIGGRPQAAGFQGKYRRVSIPSSLYVPGPCGITVIVVFQFHLTIPMSSRL